MFKGMNESEARQKILEAVAEYGRTYHNAGEYKTGDRIPYAKRVYNEDEMVNLVDSALEFWLTAGRYTEQFEKELADYLGIRYCLAVNSGSSANLLAFMALTSPLLGDRRIKPGDEIITVAAGFPTTVTPMLQYGAVPVFADVTIPQYNIDVTMLEDALSKKTKAVMIAHTMGNPFDLNTVKAFCSRNGLWLVEDNCDALGSAYRLDGEWRRTGAVGDIGTSSFYPPHHMTMGEGGAVYTDNPVLYHKYVYSHFGYNLKITDMQAAIGCAQLKKLPGFVEARKKNFAYLSDRLQGTEGKLILPEPCPDSDPSWFGFMITCREGVGKNQVVRYLEEHGVQTRMLFAGNLIKQPCFDEMRRQGEGYRVAGELRNTDRIMQDTFWIGVYPGMSRAMLDDMADRIVEAIEKEGI